MGLIDRMSTTIKARINKILNKFEDPGETLDYSYEKQLEILQDVKRGVAGITAAKKRLELQKVKLERTKMPQAEIKRLTQHIAELAGKQEELMATEKRLAAKIEVFRSTKETITAQYSGAEARVKVIEVVSGISEEMSDAGLAVQRAQNKTGEMMARAAARDELLEAGKPEDMT